MQIALMRFVRNGSSSIPFLSDSHQHNFQLRNIAKECLGVLTEFGHQDNSRMLELGLGSAELCLLGALPQVPLTWVYFISNVGVTSKGQQVDQLARPLSWSARIEWQEVSIAQAEVRATTTFGQARPGTGRGIEMESGSQRSEERKGGPQRALSHSLFDIFKCKVGFITLTLIPFPFELNNKLNLVPALLCLKLTTTGDENFTTFDAAKHSDVLNTVHGFEKNINMYHLPSFSFMGKITMQPLYREASNYDEVFMQQSLLFDDSLKDLKNLRTQLYSAAEYFELSFANDDQKQIVIETLKDYAIKALINTVDHLGSVSYKVNHLLDEKIDEVSGAELHLSCIEQRIKTCQAFMDHEGRTQQSLVIDAPKYHKRFILPAGETMRGANYTKSRYIGCNLDDEDDWHHFRNAVRATIRETPTSTVSKGRSPSPSLQPQRAAAFSFTSTIPKNDLEKRTVSPYRFPLLRTGSLSSRSTTPKTSSRPTTPNSSRRPTTPSPSDTRLRYPSEPRKSASMRLPAERDVEQHQHHSKSKRLLKTLLSRRKSKKDDMLYSYLDEY
ncbi:hypothetical protein VNO78_30733 [Psophocarpus tetragonolobus]|uniref:Protein ABIL2 n=1 Tax=Psophocarpus tetragonolobus TaxID=3891 RepID=A0AAN9RXE0_PSOTE